MRCTEIPVDAAVVVVAGPTAMIVEKEAEMLHTYMRRGGNDPDRSIQRITSDSGRHIDQEDPLLFSIQARIAEKRRSRE
jgi:Flp pilus assembly CpaF family ATPase